MSGFTRFAGTRRRSTPTGAPVPRPCAASRSESTGLMNGPASEYAARPMGALAPEVLATIVAEQFGDAYGDAVTTSMREDLARRLERAVRDAVLATRKSVADLCRERQALWVATETLPTTSALLHAEARARANA